MSYPKLMHRLQFARGMANDPAAETVPPGFFTDGSNLLCRRGSVQRIGGDRDIYATVQDDVRNLLNVRIGANNHWVYHGTDKSYAVDSSGHTDITHASTLTAQADAHGWTSGLLNGFPFANNGVDAPMSWDGNIANKFVSLTGWIASATAAAMIAHRFHLFALDTTESGTNYPHRIRWSEAAPPGTMPADWVPAADNEAGFADLAAFGGPLITAETMLQTLMVYSRTATWAAEYVRGAVNNYEFRPIFSTTGALTRHGVAAIGDGRHLVVTDGDIILTDGVSRQSVAKGRMAEFVFEQLNEDNYEALFAEYDPTHNEVLVAFPSSDKSTCDLAGVYNLDYDTWSPRELPDVSCAAVGVVADTAGSDQWNSDTDTWDSDTTKWNQRNYSLAKQALVVGEPDTPAMTELDTSDQVAADALLLKQDDPLGDPERVKFVRAAHIKAKPGYGTLFVRIGARMSLSDSIVWSDEYTLTEPEQIAYGFAQGRYISVQVRSSGMDIWDVSGADLEYERRGYH